jgi:hypothetical protein
VYQVAPWGWRQERSALGRMPRSGQRAPAREAVLRTGSLDRERRERVVEVFGTCGGMMNATGIPRAEERSVQTMGQINWTRACESNRLRHHRLDTDFQSSHT